MSLNTSTGYIRIPRSLLQDPLWIDASPEHKVIFLKLLEKAVYKPKKFDDHGKVIDIMPGQICASLSEIAEMCGKWCSKKIIERAIIQLEKYGFLGRSKGHKRSLLTITHSDTYEYFKESNGTDFGTILGRSWDDPGTEKKKEKKVKKEKACNQAAILFSRESGRFENLTPAQIELYRETFPHLDIDEQFRLMRLWLLDPSNTHRDGNSRFISNWFKRVRSNKITPIYQPEAEVEIEIDPEIKGILYGQQDSR